MKRTIQFAPAYSITKSGKVWMNREAVPAFSVNGQYGMKHLAVKIDGQRQFVWQLLSVVWYGERILLTRDGGFLNWHEDNVFPLNLDGESPLRNKVTLSEVQWIWWNYQHERIPCVSMASKTGLSYSIDEFRSLITDILKSSVR
jgi:hypothetical protein